MRQLFERTKVNGARGALQAVRAPEHFIQIRRGRRAVRRLERRQSLADPLNVLRVLDLKRGEQPLAEILHVRYLSTFLLSCCPSPVRFVAAFSSWLVLTAV